MQYQDVPQFVVAVKAENFRRFRENPQVERVQAKCYQRSVSEEPRH